VTGLLSGGGGEEKEGFDGRTMAKSLVVVESPAKARTLGRFLGDRYRVEASYGHVRDLPESAREVPEAIRKKPWGRLGVDTEGEFTPYYVIPSDKKRHVQSLKAALKDASEVLLATDPDREGESISWHLQQVLKPKVPVKRIVFHEITEEAVREALQSPHEVDENLVRAQESRRILDRLYGYTLSPVLWKKVQTGLSAGRVQSVAVRLLVEAEERRRAFRSAAYWDLEARLTSAERAFTATLVRVGNDRVASGKDFNLDGTVKSDRVRHLDETKARALVEALLGNLPWRVSAVEEKPATERPEPPFTTSTLTQEASRKLGFSTERTMQIAQRLFQGVEVGGGELEGIITYHRTDSTTLSEKALKEASRVIGEIFGQQYYGGPRRYKTRVKNAQEAHEAIRPTDFKLTPQRLSDVLESDDVRLYELIWKRTMTSQMVDARVLRTIVEITGIGPGGEPSVLTASGKVFEFVGFRQAYVEGSDDPIGELEEQEKVLPPCKVGDLIGPAGARTPITLVALDPKRHETTPPPRYTEASLVKELERAGIGRPSTYAPTIATILKRGYVFRQGKALVPSFTAFAVTTLLRDHFGDFVDVSFTAEMEEDLDEISNGQRDWLDFVRAFYRGKPRERRGLEPTVAAVEQKVSYPTIEIGVDPASEQKVVVRVGRYGPFLQMGKGGPGKTASLSEDLPPADLTIEKALALLKARAAGPRLLGVDPKTGLNVYVANGRFGAYVQLGETPESGSGAPRPRRASLNGGLTEATVTLEPALRLLELPRQLGTHPGSGVPVVAGLGRFGPYVKHGDEFRSLEAEDDVHTITLERALELLAAPKMGRRQHRAAKTALADLGPHPESGAPIRVMSGRYGPYVTDGMTNASVPGDTDPASVTIDQAVTLLSARATGKRSRRRGGAEPKTSAASTRRRQSSAG
jgi:DNA topoisomerase-1